MMTVVGVNCVCVCLVDVVVGVRVVDLKLVRVSAYYNPDIWRPAWRQGSRISTGIDDQPPAKNEKTGKMSKQLKMSTPHGTKNEKPMGNVWRNQLQCSTRLSCCRSSIQLIWTSYITFWQEKLNREKKTQSVLNNVNKTYTKQIYLTHL